MYLLDQNRAIDALEALETAQMLSLGENDPLVDAIIRFLPGDGICGSGSEIIARLTNLGADLPRYGGGQAINNRLRETVEQARRAGIQMVESRPSDRAKWSIRRVHETGRESQAS